MADFPDPSALNNKSELKVDLRPTLFGHRLIDLREGAQVRLGR